ncbi:MAG: hypothetical protein HYU83_06095 [Chloroflexi bacterium]|nr:hypothetical protein [Chloroflexota bacterium]
MKKTWYIVGMLILGLVLLAVSCGGGAAPTTPAAPTAPAAPTTPTAPTAPTAPTTPAAPTAGPPTIPHTLEGRADCLMCHQAGGLKPFPADHAGRTNDLCQACHKPA